MSVEAGEDFVATGVYRLGELAARVSDQAIADIIDREVDHDLRVESATLLVEVVKQFVLPALRKHHYLEAAIVPGIHNPIRLTEVDGVSVDGEDGEDDDLDLILTPATVDVADAAILAIANDPQLLAEQDEEDRSSAQESVLVKMTRLKKILQRQMAGLNHGIDVNIHGIVRVIAST